MQRGIGLARVLPGSHVRGSAVLCACRQNYEVAGQPRQLSALRDRSQRPHQPFFAAGMPTGLLPHQSGTEKWQAVTSS